jgi:hypothetical protein
MDPLPKVFCPCRIGCAAQGLLIDEVLKRDPLRWSGGSATLMIARPSATHSTRALMKVAPWCSPITPPIQAVSQLRE